MRVRQFIVFHCMLFAYAAFAHAQTAAPAPKPAPDTLTLASGEQLIGHFVRSTGGNVVFKSDALGELTIAWAKVKELRANGRYVVVEKNVKLTRRTDTSTLPKGTVTAVNQSVQVAPAPGAPPVSVPAAQAANIVDEATFQNVLFHNPGFFQAWNGTITGGASIVEATQQARTFTGSVALIRAVPTENWADPRDRTLVDFSASDGFVLQPSTPRIKTEIYHVNAERDEYFRAKDFYGFAQVAFDHNYSQGLDLQSNLGAGIGDTVIKKGNETLDVKGSVAYIKQDFQIRENNHSLAGSNFIETFTHKSAHGILFQQQIVLTPTWTVLSDYSAAVNASISIPVFKRLGFSTAAADNYLNNPPGGFKKNSFQLTTGLTYTLR
jgi:hypothetical protein